MIYTLINITLTVIGVFITLFLASIVSFKYGIDFKRFIQLNQFIIMCVGLVIGYIIYLELIDVANNFLIYGVFFWFIFSLILVTYNLMVISAKNELDSQSQAKENK